MWILTSDGQQEAGAFTFRVPAGAIKTVGRARRADFVLDVPMVSRVHCRLTAAAAGDLEVVDLGSTNGTFVNGRRVRRSCLIDGDHLRIGCVELVVRRKT